MQHHAGLGDHLGVDDEPENERQREAEPAAAAREDRYICHVGPTAVINAGGHTQAG